MGTLQHRGTRGQILLRAFTESRVVVKNHKRHQFTSRKNGPRYTPVCRSCENDFRRIMATPLKLLLKKLLLIPTQLLLIPIQLALEVEKERDVTEKSVEELKR